MYMKLVQRGSRGRSDNCGSLRDNGLKYIPRIAGISELEHDAKKNQAGVLSPFDSQAPLAHRRAWTARLLCSRHLRDEFDMDREGFCRNVQNDTRVIWHDDWPSYLYPEDGYNPDTIDNNLLRGPFCYLRYVTVFLVTIATY